MKKRILGLALALVMIISLLPLTAFAEGATTIKIVIRDPHIANERVDISLINASQYASQTKEYITFEDVLDTDGTTVLGNKPVFSDTKPAEGTPHIYVHYDNFVLTITFNGVTYNRAGSGDQFMAIYMTKGGNDFDVNFVFNGENKLTGKNVYITMSNTGAVNISGKGSLEQSASVASKTLFAHTGAGAMTITDATLKFNITEGTSGQTGCLSNNGDIILNQATVETNGLNSFGIRTATATSDGLVAGNVTLNGANVKLAQTSGQRKLIETNGTITFNNSNVELIANANNSKVLAKAPTITGTYSSQKYSVWDPASSTFSEKNYTEAAFNDNIRWMKLVHKCEALNDDGDCSTAVACACGKEFAPAKAHIAGANANDCTKDTMCGNAGCTKVFEAAKGTAHEAGEDDGDCTTDIKCKHCEQVAVKGAEKHTYTRTDCSKEAVCTVCNKVVAKAGEHSGGTATCKDKAKCEVCNAEYGELAACKPAADDGDCTTAIKCSVCGKETTAGQAAHKYTDKSDTTCDNAGCTNTRKVEGDATENPKTGDTALVLIAYLMMASAAAFVCTKKFAR